MVSISPQGHHDYPPRDSRAMTPSRLPPVLALEIPLPWRPAAAKKACSVATTCAPSPTAAATRLTEPDRTSPMAKTPCRLVSSDRRSLAASVPVNTNPLASKATPEPDSQFVL